MAGNTTVGQRISQLIAHLGISKNAFAMSLDKTATVVQHLVDERNKPGFDLLCKIFEVYPVVSKDWLMQGEGTMLVATTASAAAAANEDAPSLVATPPVVETAPKPVETSVVPAPPLAPAPEPAVVPPAQPVATPAPAPAIPAAAPAPAAAPDTSWQTALYTQQMAHQLAMAELRNQHLQEQQRMMQQMMELMQRQLS